MNGKIAATLVASVLVGFPCHAYCDNGQVYRDPVYKFSWHYPKTWQAQDASFQNTRIKIRSEYGKGRQDCMVNVRPISAANKISVSDLASSSFAKQYGKVVASSTQDARVISSKPSFLSNQQAIETIISYAFRASDIDVPVTAISYLTVKGDYAYTLGCRNLGADYKKQEVKFKNIALGFVIAP